MRSPEPRFARTAALIADPSRARAVSITPQTASTHLTQLLDAGLVKLRAQGRHRYFTLADADVAHMLEALSMVAERDDVRSRWDTPAYKPLKFARSCYCHLAGELGVRQHDALLARGVMVRDAEGTLALSEHAGDWLRDAQFGDDAIASLQRDSTRKRFAYSCMDWSERREHLAGVFATKLLAHFIETGWLRRERTGRALTETPPGVRALAALFAV